VGFKGLIAATAAVALMTAPTVAAAQTAPEVAPATESVSGDSELRGGFIIPLIALIAVILGLCAATNICGGDDDDLPTSP
jgi:hypothetical protein